MKNFLIALLCFMLSANVSASFTPTDGDVNIFDLTAFTISPDTEGLFAVIAAGEDPNDAVRIALNFNVWTNTIFPITGDLLNWTEVAPDLGGGFAFEAGGNTLITPDKNFDIVYFESVDTGWVLPTAIAQNGATSFNMSFGDTAGLLVSDVADVAHVPVPPAAWLFGSGLIGMVGVARRNKTV